MPTTRELREQRANIWEQMKEIMDSPAGENGQLSAEQEQKYDRLEGDFDGLEAKVERQERFEASAAKAAKVDRAGVVPPANTDDEPEADAEYARVFSSFLRNGLLDMDADDRRVLQGNFTSADGKAIRNAAGVGTGSAGGYLVPPEFRDTIIETMKWYGPMLDEAQLIETDSGANLQWPTNNDTANVGAILGENTQLSQQDLTFGTASLDAYMYTSLLTLISLQLLQDSSIDTEGFVGRKLGERIGRILNAHFTTGTGTGQPDGIVTSATVGVTGSGSLATTGGISYDNIVDLVEALDPAYGNAAGGTDNAPGLKFMMHQSVRKALRKLKDAQNRPLWEPSLQAGAADNLLGYPTRINNDMATVAQNSKSLLFGNISQAYVVRVVKELQLVQLRERYADYLQVGFFAFERADGTMQDANAVRVFQTTPTA